MYGVRQTLTSAVEATMRPLQALTEMKCVMGRKCCSAGCWSNTCWPGPGKDYTQKCSGTGGCTKEHKSSEYLPANHSGMHCIWHSLMLLFTYDSIMAMAWPVHAQHSQLAILSQHCCLHDIDGDEYIGSIV